MTGQWIDVDGFQEGDVEDGVHFNGGGELEAVGVGANAFQDLEFAKFRVVQLGGRASGLDVFPKEPYLSSDFETWFGQAKCVGVFGLSTLSSLSIGHLGNERLVEGLESLCELKDFSIGGELLCAWRDVGEELGAESIVREERPDSKGLGDGIVVGEFCQG